MRLLHHGGSNWSYYQDEDSGLVYAIAKAGSGASATIYGSLQYYNKQREAGRI